MFFFVAWFMKSSYDLQKNMFCLIIPYWFHLYYHSQKLRAEIDPEL